MPAPDAPTAAPQSMPPPASPRRCENCGAPLYGEHCHACGQPTKGLVRHFSSVLGDFFDTVFNIDSRVLRTLGPLLTRPGYLSLEYFAGRRVRYVTPMRLFLFLSLLAFFAIQGSIDMNDPRDGVEVTADNEAIDKAMTAAQVKVISDGALQQLALARKEVANVPGAAAGIDIARDKIRQRAQERIDYLKAVDAAKAAGKPLPKAPESDDDKLSFPIKGKDWDPVTNPVAFGWLPDIANAALNKRMGHARDVLNSSNSEKPLVDAMFNVLPQTLIILMPLFALMLKIAYWFKHRMYMEHLIVALHSHSFISLALTLVISFSWLRGWLAPDPGFWNGLLGWAMGLTACWIPVYLLLMQKRVYGQGWPMTLIKYGVLGISYTVLLSLGLVAAVLVGLLTL